MKRWPPLILIAVLFALPIAAIQFLQPPVSLNAPSADDESPPQHPPLGERVRLVIEPEPKSAWRKDHCGMCCAVEGLGTGKVRVFVTGAYGSKSRFAIGWVDLDNEFRIVAESKEPVMKPGRDYGDGGMGALMPCVVKGPGGEWFLYYSCNGNRLAISRDNGETFVKHPEIVLETDRSIEDVAGTCTVVPHDGKYRMFYTSVVGWNFGKGHDTRDKYKDSRFIIRSADSNDGLHFTRPADSLSFDPGGKETAARPCVWFDDRSKSWMMLYSRAPEMRPGIDRQYRIHLATSRDFRKFEDVGPVLLPVGGADAFDSERCEYAWILPDKRHFLYSGNGFGKTGLGLARLN